MKHEIALHGCAPIPLAHYLKALGILRLVSEQRDSAATCSWRNDVFCIDSALDRDELVRFFLHDYRPTPVIAPWNAGSGFYFRERKSDEKNPVTGSKLKTGVRDEPTAATKISAAVLESKADRLAGYRNGLAAAKALLIALGRTEAPKDEEKADLVLRLRNTMPDEVLAWLDAALVLTGEGLKMPPLLGTAGNGGNMDFTSNFMQRLTDVFNCTDGEPTALSEAWLQNALFGTVSSQIPSSAFGQFSPGGGGGANGGPGFDGGSSVNPWDFILMLEGTLLFAVASVKRLGATGDGALASPFTVRKAGVGYASSAPADEEDPRGETWMPLWERRINLDELRALLCEGRAQVGRRPARSGVDLMRAIVSLGVDRGITSFQRYGFHKRNGDLHFAVPLDRVRVRRNEKVDLLSEVEVFLDRFRSKASSTNPPAPAGAASALRILEESIFALCRSGVAGNVQRVLIALGGCERALAGSLRWTREAAFLKPLAGLSTRWLTDAYDGSREFRLAAALATVSGRYGADWLPLRAHLEPVKGVVTRDEKSWYDWTENVSPDVVWHEGDIVDVLNRAFARRLVRAQQAGLHTLTDNLRRPAVPIPLSDIAGFINGDEGIFKRLTDLLWSLSLVDYTQPFAPPWPERFSDEVEYPPAVYALLRLALDGRLGDDSARVPIQRTIHLRAAAGDARAASELAARRLRASGLPPAIDHAPLSPALTRRAAAALLFPLTRSQLDSLSKAVLKPDPALAA